MLGKPVIACVADDFVSGPAGKRADLDGRCAAVEDLDIGARVAVPAPQTGQVTAYTNHAPGERTHFAYVAAEHTLRNTVAKQVAPVTVHHGVDFIGVGQNALDG